MPEAHAEDLKAEKARLRVAAKQRRAAAAASAGSGAADALRDRVLDVVDFPAGAVVSAYWPMGDEIDPRPLMHALHESGHSLCLPVTAGKGRPLVFRAWAPGDVLVDGGFGTRIPGPDKPELTPRVLLVPLLAFDRTGYRLGYGGGFYDRTLAALRGRDGGVRAVGVAYAGQEVPDVPHDADDQRLELVVTERGPVVPAEAG